MSDTNFKLLNNWLLSLNLNKKRKPKLEDIHVDELIGEKDNKTMFFKSLDLFYDLIHLDFGYDLHTDYIPSLVFRLKFSEKISFDVKKNIWEEFEDSPPNIYLVPKRCFLMPPKIEEYRKQLDFEVFTRFQKNCNVYYSCTRTIEGIQNNWEYARDTCIENFGILGFRNFIHNYT